MVCSWAVGSWYALKAGGAVFPPPNRLVSPEIKDPIPPPKPVAALRLPAKPPELAPERRLDHELVDCGLFVAAREALPNLRGLSELLLNPLALEVPAARSGAVRLLPVGDVGVLGKPGNLTFVFFILVPLLTFLLQQYKCFYTFRVHGPQIPSTSFPNHEQLYKRKTARGYDRLRTMKRDGSPLDPNWFDVRLRLIA